jgi:hypothetical protein
MYELNNGHGLIHVRSLTDAVGIEKTNFTQLACRVFHCADAMRKIRLVISNAYHFGAKGLFDQGDHDYLAWQLDPRRHDIAVFQEGADYAILEEPHND